MGLATALGISGCDQIKHLVEKPVVCGDADSVRALQDKFKANVSAATKMYLSADSDINRQILTKLLNQLKIDLDQIQDQPNASYRCSARVNLTLPKSLLERANETRAARGDDSVAKAAAAQDIQLAGIEPYQTIEYTPTAGDDNQANAGYEEYTRLPCVGRMLDERYTQVKAYFEDYDHL